MELIELAFPLTTPLKTEILLSTLEISVGVAYGLAISVWSVSSRVLIFPSNLSSRVLSAEVLAESAVSSAFCISVGATT